MDQNWSHESLPDFASLTMVVIGDLMLDRYWYGDVTRISPEAPVPVVKVKDCKLKPGGAANVALNLRALGARVKLLGFVGCDQEATQLRNLLEIAGIECYFCEVAEHPTITKLRLLGQNQQLIRMDFESKFDLVDHAALMLKYQECLIDADAVVVSDYAKGSLVHVQQIIAEAVIKSLPVFVDPKGEDMTRYSQATLLTPNKKEFEYIVGSCKDQTEMIIKAQQLIKDYNIEAILITLGKAGMLLVQRDVEPYALPTRARQVFDVTGAGDTVIATFAATYAQERHMQQAAYIANTAAGIVVSKLGAGTVTPVELRRGLRKQNASEFGIVKEAELLKLLQDARAQGERIVMTNGCFDILHQGHVHYLEQAKSLGDRLIVAVNGDVSVKKLKGNSRPYNTLSERMHVLAGLRAVDWVVDFSEETPARLISALLPNVLVKGGDYQVHDIAGHEAVLANGGEVKVLSFIEGCSTTGLVERIQAMAIKATEEV